MALCGEIGCEAPIEALGLCRRHYAARRLANMPPCEIEGCEKLSRALGMCQMHYVRWRKYGDPAVKRGRWDGFERFCEVAGCEGKHSAHGLCRKHYRQRFPERNDQPWNERRRANAQKRRALKKAAPVGAPVLLEEIRERDGNRCGICGGRVNGVVYPDPLSASLDHVVPLSAGGAHDPANVQLAHLGCNVRKGARGGGEQLRFL